MKTILNVATHVPKEVPVEEMEIGTIFRFTADSLYPDRLGIRMIDSFAIYSTSAGRWSARTRKDFEDAAKSLFPQSLKGIVCPPGTTITLIQE